VQIKLINEIPSAGNKKVKKQTAPVINKNKTAKKLKKRSAVGRSVEPMNAKQNSQVRVHRFLNTSLLIIYY